jgi:hypothetical protein
MLEPEETFPLGPLFTATEGKDRLDAHLSCQYAF